MGQLILTTPGSQAVSRPAGVHRYQVRAIGGGGAGGRKTATNNTGAAGGRGGGYAQRDNMRVSDASNSFTVGGGGISGIIPFPGGDSSTVLSGVLLSASGGPSCADNSQTPPDAPVAGTGDIVFAGGASGAGTNSSGGGGGAAGLTGVGGDASGITAGTGTAPGADGATGRSNVGPGDAGTQPGGGGAGGRRGTGGSQEDGGAGGAGQIWIRWVPPNTGMLLGVGT